MLVGRLQIFNNWSPYMVADPDTVWLGLEYFCNEGDELWCNARCRADPTRPRGTGPHRHHRPADVLDGTVIRMEKTYPAYFGAYDRFDEIRQYVDGVRESVPDRPQRHAPLQQPGPLDADRHGRGGQHPGRRDRQSESLGGQHRAGIPRRVVQRLVLTTELQLRGHTRKTPKVAGAFTPKRHETDMMPGF